MLLVFLSVQEGRHRDERFSAKARLVNVDLHFAHFQELWHRVVGGFVHPVGFFRPRPTHEMIPLPQSPATPEVSRSHLVQTRHHVHTDMPQQGDQEVRAVTTVAEQNIARAELVE